MNFKRLAVLCIFLALMSGFASATLVSNSEDWRDSSLVIARSHFEDEDMQAITSLAEGQLVQEMLLDNETHTVYEPEDAEESVWDNYANFLRNEGLDDINSEFIGWEESQYEFYDEFEDDIEGVVVVRPEFTMDTLSVFPKILNENYWPIYYDGENTEEFLQGIDKHTIFYGDYMEQPWKKLGEGHDSSIISEDSREANNRGLVREITNDHDKESAVIAGDSYLEKGYMTKGDPIILAKDLDRTAELVNDLDFESIEIIGGENVEFGDSLEDQVGDDTTVVAKFGRRFTGAPGLDSTYPVKQIPGEPITRDISVDSVKYSDDGKVEVVFENEGTIETPINFSAVALSSGTDEDIISEEIDVVARPNRSTTVDVNASSGFDPETAEVSFGYEGSSGISSRNYNVENVESWAAPEVDLQDLYYDRHNEELSIELRNQGDEEAYASAQIYGLKLINKSLQPVTDDVVQIEPGSTETLSIDAYMSEEDIEANQDLRVAATVGDSENTSKDLYTFGTVQMETRDGGIIVIIVQYGPLLLLILLILALLYYLKKRREQKKYRGLK